jgi:cytochrome c oxidase cbb3-type subunit I
MRVNPFLVTSVLFLFLAGLAALDSALTSFHLLPWFNGLRWLRVHLITLGALSEAMFGILPALISAGSSADKSRPRWDIWLALTLGILTLMVGIPLVNYVLIVTGGMLVFLAALLLVGALARPALAPRLIKNQVGIGRMFYLAGLLYLLLGIILGSGLWFGWGKALGIANPIEVHIHTNTWGFMSLVFAGLFVDLYPRWTGCNLARPDHIWPIFWLMTSGALGSVLGPWLALNTITALGIVLHQAATVWLLSNLIRPLKGTTLVRKPGIWHLITAYTWQLAVVLAAPLIFLLRPDISTAGIEATAPQVLIFGWMLLFGFALLPYLLRKATTPQANAELGGSWFSLVAVHAGGIFLGASILIPTHGAPLLGIAYLLWFVSFLPVAHQMWQILNSGMESQV